MSEKEIRHRMSASQKSILITLFLLTKRLEGPHEVTKIRNIINSDRISSGHPELQVSNFSVSCKTLFTRGLLKKYRDKASLKVLYSLSETGYDIAENEVEALLKDIKNEC